MLRTELEVMGGFLKIVLGFRFYVKKRGCRSSGIGKDIDIIN